MKALRDPVRKGPAIALGSRALSSVHDSSHDADDFRWKPERRLMLAVLQDAMLVLNRNSGKCSLRARWLVSEVEAWLASDARTHPFAFATICDVLGLEPDCVRKAIHKWNLPLSQPPRRRRADAGRLRRSLNASGTGD